MSDEAFKLQHELDRKELIINEFSNEIAQKDLLIDEYKHKINLLEANEVKHQEDLMEWIGENKDLRDQIVRLTAHIEDIDKSLEIMLNKNNELSSVLSNKDNTIDFLEGKIVTLNDRIRVLEMQLGQCLNIKLPDSTVVDSVSDKESIENLQTKVVILQSQINSLNLLLEDARKEADRAKKLQVQLENRNKEVKNLMEKLEQKDLELSSNENALRCLSEQLDDYKNKLDVLTTQANETIKELSSSVQYYKESAIEVSKEKIKVNEANSKLKKEISTLKDQLLKLESGEYGLADAAQENRTLKTMFSQRQAKIADLVLQLDLYESVIASLEKELGSNFDYDKLLQNCLEIQKQEKDKIRVGSRAIKVIQKAISNEKDLDCFEIIVDHESVVSHKNLIVKPQIGSSLPPKKQPDNGVIILSKVRNNKNYDNFRPISKNTKSFEFLDNNKQKNGALTNALERESIGKSKLGEDGHKPSTMISRGLDDDKDSKNSEESLSQEHIDLKRKLSLYKLEIENLRSENYEMNLKIKRLQESPSKRIASIISPDNSDIESLSSARLSRQISRPMNSNMYINTIYSSAIAIDPVSGKAINMDKNSNDVFSIRVVALKNKPSMLKGTDRTLHLIIADTLFQLTPKVESVKGICNFSQSLPSYTLDAESFTVSFDFNESLELVQKPVLLQMKEKRFNMIVLTTVENFKATIAQKNTLKYEFENIQRSSSSNQNKILELEERLTQEKMQQERLNEIIKNLRGRLEKQRVEFQERILGIKHETDRFIEKDRENNRKILELSKPLNDYKSHSQNLPEVSSLINKLQDEKATLKYNLKEAVDNAEYMQKKNSELIREIKTLRDDRLLSKSQPVDTKKEAIFQKYATKLKDRLKDMTQKCKDLEDENETLKRKSSPKHDIYGGKLPRDMNIEELKDHQKIEIIQQTKVEYTGRIRRLQAKVYELSNKNAELQNHLVKSTDTIKKLNKILKMKETSMASLQQEKAHLRQLLKKEC